MRYDIIAISQIFWYDMTIYIGYEYEVVEPKLPRRKPKNYADTMGRNGPPITTNIQGGDTGSANE